MNVFKRNLLIGYSTSLFLLLISSIVSYISIQNLLRSQKLVMHTNSVINKIDNVFSVLKDAETGQRGYLLTGNEVFLEPYNGAYDKSMLLINQTKMLTADNPRQQVDCDLLSNIVSKRLNYLATLIEEKKKGMPIKEDMLLEGKNIMDNVRKIVSDMDTRENILLQQRTESLNRFATSTPLLIIVASLLAILVTIVSFFRVLKDFRKREELQQQLQNKEVEISKRLTTVQKIADQISSGDYQLKIDDEGNDTLGSIAGSLNHMAASLDYSFNNLKDREWLQTGIADLNENMIGENNLDVLAYKVIEQITGYTHSQTGAFYYAFNGHLILSASIALSKERLQKELEIGEGIAGQCAKSGKVMYLQNFGETEMVLHYSAGAIKPKAIFAIPVYHEKTLKAVIEIASLQEYKEVVHEFLKNASFNIGMAIHSARDHARLQELLSETQAQSEELQAQHSELENINAELEAHAEKLQASDEELRVQQEELQQANQELEERSRLLEEKNELILERNLDIQAKSEALELSTRYKSEFLANMSHELRTPLNSILLLSRLLSENHQGNLSTDQIEYSNVIQSSGKGLLTLIDEILDLSKIESGKMTLEYSDVNIGDVVAELRSLFIPIAKEKGLQFAVEMDTNIPKAIETDRLRLEQIIRNFISNALKFTRQGSVLLKIWKEEIFVCFMVKDTGIGIAEEKHQTIFEAFQQADGSTRRQYGGTGLGLSISRELAKLLGGEIRLHSEEGKGSEFTLLIPIEQNENPVTAKTAQPNLKLVEKDKVAAPIKEQYVADVIPASIPDDREMVKQGDKVILIIEDDTSFARSVLDFTRQRGYKGVVAVRGDEGLELAKKFLPLGILLDVQLPVLSGWEVMEALKNDPVTRPIPVHMMSSHQVKTKSLSKGAIDFINKPVAFEKLGEMFQKIEEALSRYPKKVLIVEENPKHAQALAYFLEGYNVNAEIKSSVTDGIQALNENNADCVILDMGMPSKSSYDTLETVKKTPGLESIPIIIFTGKNLSHLEEMKIKQFADSIVIKTAHSYQRILDEVSLFLHLVEENKKSDKPQLKYKKLGELSEVLKGKTVLVADDDVRNIFSLTKSLENYGIQVASAIDGKEALHQLEENGKIDLVLMDMMMPEMDGYESTKRIRENPKYKNLPIIAVTAKAMTGDREKCINAGASDYITKPVDVDQLISLLRVWLYE